MSEMADLLFADPRLARIYDELEGARDDLDYYDAIAREFAARSVIDLGCGTGTFACRLALRGLTVTGIDPAAASLDVARTKLGAERVRWLHGQASALTELDGPSADLVVMTGNVAQVFVSDDEWLATLAAARTSLTKGGHLVFETRDPKRRAWEAWTREHTLCEVKTAHEGVVRTWIDLVDVALPFISFCQTHHFLCNDEVYESHSTLRFRARGEIEADLATAGFEVQGVRDAPDRPGREWVFVSRALG
jgi:ubiquinone/menaquinone biosynthesis C-methylase UbiE